MRTLELHFGLGRIHLSPAAGSELIIDCAERDRPDRTESPDSVTLSAKQRTVFGISVPRLLSWKSQDWTLQVPVDFDRIIVQADGATVVTDTLEWADAHLEGVTKHLVSPPVYSGLYHPFYSGLCHPVYSGLHHPFYRGAVAPFSIGQITTHQFERLNGSDTFMTFNDVRKLVINLRPLSDGNITTL
ncbi:hypothetical protein CKO12_13760 [Chromatium okenii]|uniref:hypothetical protein n=1 Tax=Chromatium okenii TaxID=61644 RepID=UPI001903E566|nr:hypothetical protein [Chromatium okenii]MBK1642914.1 hypothetical protein [Chromatium okenii]